MTYTDPMTTFLFWFILLTISLPFTFLARYRRWWMARSRFWQKTIHPTFWQKQQRGYLCVMLSLTSIGYCGGLILLGEAQPEWHWLTWPIGLAFVAALVFMLLYGTVVYLGWPKWLYSERVEKKTTAKKY